MTVTNEAPKYRPTRPEVACVAQAIRLMANALVEPNSDMRWAVGRAEGVADAMSIFDPWCEDAEDGELWKQCARMHDARPADDERAALRRKAAWFEYIRTAAEWTVTEVVA